MIVEIVDNLVLFFAVYGLLACIRDYGPSVISYLNSPGKSG